MCVCVYIGDCAESSRSRFSHRDCSSVKSGGAWWLGLGWSGNTLEAKRVEKRRYLTLECNRKQFSYLNAARRPNKLPSSPESSGHSGGVVTESGALSPVSASQSELARRRGGGGRGGCETQGRGKSIMGSTCTLFALPQIRKCFISCILSCALEAGGGVERGGGGGAGGHRPHRLMEASGARTLPMVSRQQRLQRVAKSRTT